MIRTIIVDDEILSRIGLQSFLDGKEDIVVSGIFGEVQEAFRFLEENMVDVVLTDIEMSEINGLEFIRQIRQRHLAKGVIIVSCHDDFSYAQKAISLGVSKINVNTECQLSFADATRKYVEAGKDLEGKGFDPRSQSEDLGDNNMKANEYGIKNLKRVMENILTWTAQPDGEYTCLLYTSDAADEL